MNRSTLFVVFLVGALAGIVAVQGTRLLGPASDLTLKAGAAGGSTDFEQAVINTVRTVGPSVVSVRTEKYVVTDRFFGDTEREPGLGTGVVVSADGYILTNNHVTAGADQITVTTQDGKSYRAQNLGGDSRIDLAVIKINATSLKPAVTGDSDKLTVGQMAIAIGNPLGFERTVTTGIVSALKRNLGDPNFPDLENLIQTDASINPGNSGGPLADSSGRVIGINAILVTGGERGGSGIGFAIPINYARKVLSDVKQYGHVRGQAGIGAAWNDVPPEARQAGIPDGALLYVYPNTPAAEAGLLPYDIITKVDDTTISGAMDLRRYLRTKSEGDVVHITFYRPDTGKRQTVSVTLGKGR